MSFISSVFAYLYYFATLVLVVGLLNKIVQYARTPAPLKIPTTPAPITRTGVTLRMLREVVFFESLFRGNKWTWLFGWIFHFGLFLVTLRHLRYILEPVPVVITMIQPFGIYGGIAMVVGLAGLWARRFLVDRVQYITARSDHLILGLIVTIGLTGLFMRFFMHTDIMQVKAFYQGLYHFEFHLLPADPVLLIHLLLVAALLIIFPYSKLLHAPGLFFSPTRNQVDNARDQRHLAPWARRLEQQP
ncbi:respiratory nitrate reductase subunit gamma [Rhodoferax sp. 4810]|uniref:Respiratory nitrate reductase subunit gamma n=1 Tax=Thiospirillum jenense TaxID=1653858 RepID=A0A839H8L7_9GAMM|nr:respiratory nitrate reductase subunit gamma [Thiospirillum jenense]MBB1073393.1 respiratory nitrate reductase subunit gamma [Rhodoferax jenense]MBB1125745.1 respiratory nitrate reductase subunit gamma [Thiospirillum jenense]